jgi:H+/gluconate symporter-like permease
MSKAKELEIPFELLQSQMKEHIIDLLQRPPEAVAIALVFAVTELMHLRTTKEEDLPETLGELIKRAGEEALTLTDEVFLAKPPSSETIH